MKKLVLATFFITLAVFSASAQKSVDNFLGNWKSTKLEGAVKSNAVQTVTLNVTQAAGNFKIERTTQGVYDKKDYSYTQTSAYKIDGSSATALVDGSIRILTSYMKITAPNKLMLRYNIETDTSATGLGDTEQWTLSADGRTLTVEWRGRYGSSKTVFTKQ